jgi:hypothetical protein
MKVFNKTILVLLAVVAISFTSCKKDDDGGGGGGQAGSGQIVAKVNGSDFSSMEIASRATLTAGGGSTTLLLQGTDASGKGFVITMYNYEGVGTYEFTDSNVFLVGIYVEANVNNPMDTQNWSAPYEGSGIVGEIKISEKTDTSIKGTFNFTAKNVNGDQSLRNITDGSFNLNF